MTQEQQAGRLREFKLLGIISLVTLCKLSDVDRSTIYRCQNGGKLKEKTWGKLQKTMTKFEEAVK